MKTLLLLVALTAAMMLPFTGWWLGRATATPVTTIVYLPAATPAVCVGNSLWRI